MKIEKLRFKNVRSYGNEIQELDFTEDIGELILLLGVNGNGKSSISDAFDYNLFGKVKSKDGGNAKLASVPNWYNGDMMTEIEMKLGEDSFKIKRCLAPATFEFTENYKPFDRAGKANKQDYLESKMELDFKSWRNFVNISVADFKNFMSLSAADKKELIDKLFNLNQINELATIAKDMKKDIDLKVKQLEKSLETHQYSQEKLNKSIQETELEILKIESKNIENLQNEIKKCKEQIQLLKEQHTQHNESLKPLQEKIEKINSKTEEFLEKQREIKSEIKNLEREIQSYQENICPTCKRPFEKSKEKDSQFDEICSNHLTYKEKYSKLEVQISKVKEMKLESEKEIKSLDNQINQISQNAKEYQTKGKMYAQQLEENSNPEILRQSIQRFKQDLLDLEEKSETISKNLEETKDDLVLIDKLHKLLGDKGIKRDFVENLIPMLNRWVIFYLNKLESKFKITFDENFEAKSFFLNQEVDIDCLSRGQLRKANLAVLLACLKIMRMQKYINILFLDEVFDSIDVDNIKLMLEIFREFSKEHNIHILIVHQAEIEQNFFDKVYEIKMDIFSSLHRKK